eukprot:XP_015573231.1 IST1-like protein isoform X2 [Ricinus communis]
MGALLAVFLGRKFKASKFKTIAKLAISRVTILKNQKQVRYSHAKSDVVELLNCGHQERALLRVEHMIKEQNLVDAFIMIEDYCYLLIDRITLLKKEKECHDEVKEAISTLIFASSRCGEFPELQEIRGIFESKFGKEFAARAIELRNNCGVNPKKLSVRRPSLENRMKVLKETASEKGIVLHLEEDTPVVAEEKLDDKKKKMIPQQQQQEEIDETEPQDKPLVLIEVLNPVEKLSKSTKARNKYRDVTAAALEAFESAAYAASAARAAVELSRPKCQESDRDDHNGFSHPGPTNCKLVIAYEDPEKMENSNDTSVFKKIHLVDYSNSESESEDMAENNGGMCLRKLKESKNKLGIDRKPSALSSDSDWNIPSPKHQELDFIQSQVFPQVKPKALASQMQ